MKHARDVTSIDKVSMNMRSSSATLLMMMTIADPMSILQALEAHLSPSPLLAKLPIALELYAHLQLLSARIKSECRRALAEQEILADELMRKGVPPVKWLDCGALNQREGRRMKRWAGRDGEGRMFGFSLEFRKHVSEARLWYYDSSHCGGCRYLPGSNGSVSCGGESWLTPIVAHRQSLLGSGNDP